jgi:hypothetical protein
MMMPTLLLSPFHDPEARQLTLARRLTRTDDPLAAAWLRIAARYTSFLAVASPASDPRSLAALAAAGWEVAAGRDGPDRGLWEMVRLGLARPVDHLHFCDLDRLLHWLDRYPDELAALPAVWPRYDLTMLVRSDRAFASHPACQTITEGTANAVLAHRLGRSPIDAFSGSYVWSRRGAEAVLAAPGPRDLRFYAEAVLAPFRRGCEIGHRVVEGLEWETPDQYPAEIARDGFDRWLTAFQSPAQWRARAEMARVFVEAALT